MDILGDNKIKMVVCDMAGTTINENNLVYKTLQTAINKFGYQFSLEEVLEKGAGKEKKEAILSILANNDQDTKPELVDEIFKVFISLLEESYRKNNIVGQNGVLDFFKILKSKNILIVLNTGYDRRTAQNLLANLGWNIGAEIDGLVTADDVLNNRPSPDMICYAMNLFNVKSAKEVIKIGDSIIDIEEGINAGCKWSIGITTGAHTASQLKSANPDYLVDSLMEIIPIINFENDKEEV